jgi:16S rRNA (uracil1498-N3)-methyltransferase
VADGFPSDVDAAAHVYVESLDDRCDIGGRDGHHLERVRRLTTGERVTAADGAGNWRLYEIVSVASGTVMLDARTEPSTEPVPSVAVGLAVALTKGGLDDVVAAVTELGVARITPVRTARTVVQWDDKRAETAVSRLRTIARESGMQSRRARLPQVDEVIDIAALASRADLVVADPHGVLVEDLPKPAGRLRTVLVGPEGGLAPTELELLSEAPRLRLGPHVLRATTAPIAAVAVLAAISASPENRPY